MIKGSKDVARVLVGTEKKILVSGVRIFCEWHNKWRTFSLPWPTSPVLGSSC